MLGGIVRPRVVALPPPFWGLEFDGTDDYAVAARASASDFDFGTASFTMIWWINPSADDARRWFFASKDAGNGVIYAEKRADDTFHLRCTDALGVSVSASGTSTMGVAGTQWVWVGAVVDRTAGKVYVFFNGAVDNGAGADIGAVGTMTFAAGDVRLGYLVGGGYYAGTIAQLRVWKGTALTAAQMLAEYNNIDPYGWPGPTPTLLHAFQPGTNPQTPPPFLGATTFQLGSASGVDTNDPTWVAVPYRRLGPGGPS